MNEKLDFKYIIVDEYQDISRQRFDLTKELSKICNAKIIAVGDDWQSIYAFSGSDITLFTHFCDIMGYGKELKITKTYRNAQEVIDIAGNFVQKNEQQIKKSLISPKSIQKPVIIDTYSEDFDRSKFKGKGGKYFQLGKKVEEVIGRIIELNKQEGLGQSSSILLIGRFGFDARNLCFSNDFVYDEDNNKIFSKKYRTAKLEFLTAHSSKGLGYDNVVIINARNEVYGFPSKIDDDPVMNYVVKDDKSIDYAEERRLFYVAMTRTKNRVFIVTPEQHPSEFILELINDYPNVTVNGYINKNDPINPTAIKKCPICGYPLQLRYNKNYGYKLWICANDPEICNFISNELIGGDMSIQKCDWCKDGYLVVKKTSAGDAILACTNYKKDGTGCNRTMNHDYYKRWIVDGFEDDLSVDKPSFFKEIQQEVPKVLPISKPAPTNEKKKAEVHTTGHTEKFIEQDGFQVIVDDDGQLITNMELLSELRSLRNQLSKDDKRPAYTIITNKGLVSLATFRPTTKDKFISLYGLGEATYSAYGQQFIDAIKKYEQKHNK
jgi:DNA helicase-4